MDTELFRTVLRRRHLPPTPNAPDAIPRPTEIAKIRSAATVSHAFMARFLYAYMRGVAFPETPPTGKGRNLNAGRFFESAAGKVGSE